MVKRNAVAFEVAGDDDPRWKDAGAYWFYSRRGKKAGLIFACPCGCGAAGRITFDAWTVTETPRISVTPSIGFSKGESGFHWHGYLRDGVFEEC